MKKNVVLVTGGAGGIGKVCAENLGDYQLIITDHKQEMVDEAVQSLTEKGLNAVGIACDITDEKSLATLVDFTQKQGILKAIVHTAGVSGTVNNVKLVYDINLLATYNIIHAFKPFMKENSVMIVFSSIMGHAIPANETQDYALRNPHLADSFATIESLVDGSADIMYNYTKRACLLFATDYAMEFGQQGARIVSVSPGVIMTPMGKKALEEHPEIMAQNLKMTPANRWGTPEDVAKAIKFLISDDASFITGTDLLVDGGITSQILG